MKSSKALLVWLVICGIIGIYVGIEILFFPVTFYKDSGIEIGGNVSLMNELRASGGSLLACGTLVALGAFWVKLRFTAIVLSSLLYLSYGFSRVFSMVVDGMPEEILLYVAALEITIGLICLFALIRFRSFE